MFAATIAPVIGFVLAMLWTGLHPPRGAVGVSPSMRGFTLVGAGVALLGALVIELSGNNAYSTVTSFLPLASGGWRYVTPLLGGLVGVLILTLPPIAHRSRGSAQLVRRTAFTFARRWWLILAGVLVATIILLSVAAGAASSPDEEGRYRLLAMDSGAAEIRVLIYGWHYSLPSLVALVLFIGTTFLALRGIARPPLTVDAHQDTAVREERTRNVMGIFIGGLLLHLGAVLTFLAHTGTSSVGVFQGQDIIPIIAPFAAFGPVLWVLGVAASVLGFTCWFEIVLRTARRPAPRPASTV